jgi:hypothetical protein
LLSVFCLFLYVCESHYSLIVAAEVSSREDSSLCSHALIVFRSTSSSWRVVRL